jgi:acyl carrier protein
MDVKDRVLSAFCEVINALKKTGLRPEQLQPGLYLGGDLGIDSIEMLELWYDLEERLGVRITDLEKRNVYTVAQVLAVANRQL